MFNVPHVGLSIFTCLVRDVWCVCSVLYVWGQRKEKELFFAGTIIVVVEPCFILVMLKISEPYWRWHLTLNFVVLYLYWPICEEGSHRYSIFKNLILSLEKYTAYSQISIPTLHSEPSSKGDRDSWRCWNWKTGKRRGRFILLLFRFQDSG